MARFRWQRFRVGIALAIACAACGCARDAKEHMTLTAQVLGREYTAEIEGKGQLYPSGLITTLKFGNNHQLGIEKERLLLDGKECAKIRPDARRFTIVYSNLTLTVRTDGSVVLAASIPANDTAQNPPSETENTK
ncbi:MAG: hypothetical protein HZB26_09360 [Candidatus Hydrogenedentes bacterium]|nr:hypothetical protein [Candidatus Hydrogenedentota bacterium]